jgi:hypothetical protein
LSRVDCGENCGVAVHPNPDVRKLLADQNGIGTAPRRRFGFLELCRFVTDHAPTVDTNEVISK